MDSIYQILEKADNKYYGKFGSVFWKPEQRDFCKLIYAEDADHYCSYLLFSNTVNQDEAVKIILFNQRYINSTILAFHHTSIDLYPEPFNKVEIHLLLSTRNIQLLHIPL